jgi:hypothetical protein
MSTRVLSFVLLTVFLAGFSLDAWAQVVPSGESTMLVPPPVSDSGYPTGVGAEKRSNFFHLGVTFRTGYIDNLYSGASSGTISETTYSIFPTIEFDQTTYRHDFSVVYKPGFTFYHPSSALNEVDQSATGTYDFRITPHVAIRAADTFLKTSTSFNPASIGSVSLSGPAPAIITPFASLLTNSADGVLSYQFSPTSMIGLSGDVFILRYPNLNQVPGLYDSNEGGGGFFYNYRLTGTQYLGANYRYERITVSPTGAKFKTQTDTIFFFYTIYLQQHLSLSVSGGPQYYEITQTGTLPPGSAASAGMTNPVWRWSQMRLADPRQVESSPVTTPTTSAWTPAVAASMGWQERHTNFVAGYARTVTSGRGLVGTFTSNSASATGRWQMLQKWTSGAGISYSSYKTVDALLVSSTEGGHSLATSVTLEHPIGQHFYTSFGYDHLHQSYGGIPVISANPNSNRISGSISWQFVRPLGGR